MKASDSLRRLMVLTLAALLSVGGRAALAQTGESEHSLKIDFQVKNDPATGSHSATVTYSLDGSPLDSVDLGAVIKDQCAIDKVGSSLELAKESIAFSDTSWKELQSSLQSIAVTVDGEPYGTMDLKQSAVNIALDASFLAASASAATAAASEGSAIPAPPTIDQCCDKVTDVRNNCDGPHPLRTTQQITLPCEYSDGCRIHNGTKTCNLVQNWQTTTCVKVTTWWYNPKNPPPAGCSGFLCPAGTSTTTGPPVVTRTLESQYLDNCGECH